jgi:hypothetical protein
MDKSAVRTFHPFFLATFAFASALWAQQSPILKTVAPKYADETARPNTFSAKVRMLVFADGSPYSVDSTSVPLEPEEVRALMNFQFQAVKGGAVVTFPFSVRRHLDTAPPAIRDVAPMPQSVANLIGTWKLDRALEFEKGLLPAGTQPSPTLCWFGSQGSTRSRLISTCVRASLHG